jgi:uncharacterized protein (TIGR02996 family)
VTEPFLDPGNAMSSGRAELIAAILRAPEDDGPRLACADWFEEQGGEENVARAEFIRSQVLRARLAHDDARQSEMYARELRLLRRHGPAWSGAHFVFRKSRFRRGFIEYVHLHLRHFQHHRRQMFALEPVRDVSLTGWRGTSLEQARRVAACAEWRHVESLRIDCRTNQRTPEEVIALLESPHLAGLRRFRCDLISPDADIRRRFEQVFLHGGITDFQLPALWNIFHNPGEWFPDGVPAARPGRGLHSLRLALNLRLDALRRFTASPLWEQLSALDAHVGSGDQFAFLRDHLPPSLRWLRVAANPTADEAAVYSFVDRLAELPLEWLYFEGTTLTLSAAALARLLVSTSRCKLRYLEISVRSPFELEHAEVLAASPGSRHLRTLRLKFGNAPSEAILRALTASDHLNGIVSLRLTGNAAGSGGLRVLAAAEGLQHLRSLELLFDGYSRESLLALAGSPAVRGLNYLCLRSFFKPARITPAIAEALTRLPNLAVVRMDSGHSISPRAARILAAGESPAYVQYTFSDGLALKRDDVFAEYPPVDDMGGNDPEEV